MSLLFILIDLYSLVLFGSVILSWVQVSPDNPVVRVIHQLTEPVLLRVRNILPAAGGFDFSPMLVLIGLQLIKGLLVRL
jgi:YggT family protein